MRNVDHLMKTSTCITCVALLAAGLISALPLRSQNPAAVAAEQYRILPGINAVGQPKQDQQIERELNALAAEGWKVRAANQTSIILAR